MSKAEYHALPQSEKESLLIKQVKDGTVFFVLKAEENSTNKYQTFPYKAVQFTPGEIPKRPDFLFIDDPLRPEPINPINVDVAYIEGFLSSNQYLTQSRRFRNIQIYLNKQEQDLQILRKSLNKTANHLRDSEKDLEQLVSQNNRQLVDIENLRLEIGILNKIIKELKETKESRNKSKTKK